MKNKLISCSIVRTVLFAVFFTLLVATPFMGASQTITGSQMACVGESKQYQINNPQPGVNYSWSVNPAGLYSIAVMPNNEAIIQWGEVSTPHFTIAISDGSVTVATLNVLVNENVDPYITTKNYVGCQSYRLEGEDLTTYIMDDSEGCVNVCANSIVDYKVHGQLIGGVDAFNKYDWEVIGGVFLPSNTTTLQGAFFTGYYPDPALHEEVTVHWGSIGTGYLTVTETSIYQCEPVTSRSICVNIIESPTALFTFDDLTQPLQQGNCYEVCLNATVSFRNLSTSSDYPIIKYEWDFGDNSPYSYLKTPSHVYNQPGQYRVRLTVTNECECSDTFYQYICVHDEEGPNINCPNIICANNTGTYWTDSDCAPYIWSVQGGTITGQTDNTVDILWDNVGSDGFGFVMLDGSTCDNTCPLVTKMRVPVIQDNGHIEGPSIVCVDQQYLYKLPPWPATNFYWNILNDNTGSMAVTYLSNSHELSILTGNTPGSFTLECFYQNTLITDCGGVAEIFINVKPQPMIDAPQEVCLNSDVDCQIVSSQFPHPPFSVTGITSFTVYKPDGTTANVNTANNANTITLPGSIFDIPGHYMISASNPANFCDPEWVMVKVVDLPPPPTAITGETEVCLMDPYTYSADYLHGTSVEWTVVGGNVAGTTSNTASGLNVTVIWTSSSAKSITATRFWDNLPDCYSTDLVLNVNHIVITGQITGAQTPCEDTESIYSLDTYGVTPEVIKWSLLPDDLGSITQGQGTDEIEITWLHLGGSHSCQIRCEVTKCGITSTAIIYNVTVQGSTSITSVTPTGSFCSGEPITFNATIYGAPASSFLWDMGDGNTFTTGSSLQHTYYNFNSSASEIFPVSVVAVSTCNNNHSQPYTLNIEINPQPDASISPAENIYFCPPMGSYPLSLSNNSQGNFNIEWYFIETGTTTEKLINGANGLTTYTVTSALPNVSPSATTSQGTYFAIVTNTNTTCSTRTNEVTIEENPNCGGSGAGCTPMAPAGISSLSVSLIDCATIQATCNTAGTPGVNIISYDWTVMASGTPFTQTGTPTQNLSPEFTLSQPGQYMIKLDVLYENDAPAEPPCLVSKSAPFVIPVVADIRWGIQCAANNIEYELIVHDNSIVYPGHQISQRQWLLNGIPESCTNPTCTLTVTPGANYTLELIAEDGTTFPCTTSVNINVPVLPTADFTMSTNHPVSNNETCEGQEVQFTNTSTPVADIISSVWIFNNANPPAESHLFSTAFSYVHDPNNLTLNPTLTVTNNYGCTDTKSEAITVYQNDITFSGNPDEQYLPLTYTICQGGSSTSAFAPVISGGTNTPLAYQWYTGPDPLPNHTSPTLDVDQAAMIGSGAYWVKITDAHNCYREINPTPAKLSIVYAPTAIIEGKQDACFKDKIELTALTGYDPNNTDYHWVVTSPNPGHPPSIHTTRQISIPADEIGVYTFQLTVTSQTTSCSSTSYLFEVTVHPLPAKPTIGLNVLDCEHYLIELSATSSITPAPAFNWSNGTAGSTTTVSHGGAYRVWVTDQYGCRNHEEIVIPLAPNTYFWRFPEDGCYKFCPDDLERWIHGPEHVEFAYWGWYKDGNPVNHNHPYQGHGYTSVCEPLRIDVNPDGEGPGDYFWRLDNGLCAQHTRTMNWRLEDCCTVELVAHEAEQLEMNMYNIDLEVTVSTQYCSNPSYNISVIDPVTGNAIGSFTSISPTTLQQGPNQLNGTFQLFNYSATVIIRITVFCGIQEKCIGQTLISIPGNPFKKAQDDESGSPESEKGLTTELHIFPNPTSTRTNIVYRMASEKITSGSMLRIMDATGRVVETINLHETSGTQTYDTGHLKPGIYFVELIENSRRVLTKRMMIIR